MSYDLLGVGLRRNPEADLVGDPERADARDPEDTVPPEVRINTPSPEPFDVALERLVEVV